MAESKESTEYILRGKGLYDECETIDQMIGRHEMAMQDLRQLKEWGYRLTAPVEDDYAFLSTTNVAFAVEEGFDEEHFED